MNPLKTIASISGGEEPGAVPGTGAPDDVVTIAARPTASEIAAWVILATLLGFIMLEHLAGALIAGLALYLILDRLSESFSKRMSGAAARPLALLLVFILGGGIAVGAVAMLVSVVRHHANNIPEMMTKMADILQSTRAWLGGYGQDIIPEVMTDAENMKGAIVEWLKSNAAGLKTAGGNVGHGVVHLVMGALLAVMAFFRHVTHRDGEHGSLALALSGNVQRFTDAFRRIATAQIKISAVNTALTGIYLLVVLPLFGRHIPFATTIVLVTFVCGLIPVLGNLISNSVIVVLSLGVSVGTAVASLIFLIVVHKLEYLINSRIVGGETDSQAWEILLAIILGETAFGVAGVVVAPIVYAFVKRELRERKLV